uniref:Uncharacterized protein n=1 Tax=Cacopsylla melanoneura TaxID=428564 RepID=A0A8D8TD08_9HEMI
MGDALLLLHFLFLLLNILLLCLPSFIISSSSSRSLSLFSSSSSFCVPQVFQRHFSFINFIMFEESLAWGFIDGKGKMKDKEKMRVERKRGREMKKIIVHSLLLPILLLLLLHPI